MSEWDDVSLGDEWSDVELTPENDDEPIVDDDAVSLGTHPEERVGPLTPAADAENLPVVIAGGVGLAARLRGRRLHHLPHVGGGDPAALHEPDRARAEQGEDQQGGERPRQAGPGRHDLSRLRSTRVAPR